MKLMILAAMSLTLPSTGFCQGRRPQFWPPGGFGNVLFPGTGNPPGTPHGGVAGSNCPLRPLSPRSAKWWRPSQFTIVPIPIYDTYSTVDGSSQEGIDQGDPTVNSMPAPSAAINSISQTGPQRNSIPSEEVSTSRAPVPNDARPTIYLIALIDHSVVQALGYWRKDVTLYYVSADYGMNQISISLIDQNLSERLNSEHGVEFKVPGPK